MELTAKQKKVTSSKSVNYIGTDARNRPVVEDKAGKWGPVALTQKGDPFVVSGKVQPLPKVMGGSGMTFRKGVVIGIMTLIAVVFLNTYHWTKNPHPASHPGITYQAPSVQIPKGTPLGVIVKGSPADEYVTATGVDFGLTSYTYYMVRNDVRSECQRVNELPPAGNSLNWAYCGISAMRQPGYTPPQAAVPAAAPNPNPTLTVP